MPFEPQGGYCDSSFEVFDVGIRADISDQYDFIYHNPFLFNLFLLVIRESEVREKKRTQVKKVLFFSNFTEKIYICRLKMNNE